ncbi:RNA polymerase sigma factor, partial [Actinoallomurus liliacearum]|uniref:RNA polymerase sigma factor n=1 Tax=Actinoallomurus liliacearum TaxID=1080073 RepID=UPI0031EFEC60
KARHKIDLSRTPRSTGQALGGMLKRLSAGERDLLLLIAWADLTYEEAAEALGVPVGTVRSRLHRARQKARKVLGDTDPLTITEETPA